MTVAFWLAWGRPIFTGGRGKIRPGVTNEQKRNFCALLYFLGVHGNFDCFHEKKQVFFSELGSPGFGAKRSHFIWGVGGILSENRASFLTLPQVLNVPSPSTEVAT